MKIVFIIVKKEILDILRDTKSVIVMMVLPLLLFPLLTQLVVRISISHTTESETRRLKIGLISNHNAKQLTTLLQNRKDVNLNLNIDFTDLRRSMDGKEIDVAIVVSKDFDAQTTRNSTGNMDLYYKTSSESNIIKERVTRMVDEFKEIILSERLKEKNLNKDFATPVKTNLIDIASSKEKTGEYLGGVIPYIFIIFCFMGAVYPSIDIGVGEKANNTIQTLLTSPVSRTQIVMGKFLVIVLSGLISACLSIIGAYYAFSNANLPQNIMHGLVKIIEIKAILLTIALLIPLSVLFASLLLAISIYSKSLKEANSLITPLNFTILIPILIAALPGVEFNSFTAIVPLLNVSLATKEIIAGTIKTTLLIEVFGSIFVYATVSLYFCKRWFEKESVILRGI